MNTTEKKELTAADLAFYLGAECEVKYNIEGFRYYEDNGTCLISGNIITEFGRKELTIKPILRPLSDMTVAEKNNYIWDTIPEYTDFQGLVKHISPVFLWLMRQHFDLFGWIEAGLAIDKTKTP